MLTTVGFIFALSLHPSEGGLLGAGTGEGSCAAAPFRAYEVKWPYGCPSFAPCCSEYGYCRPLEEWDYGKFRDCNGVSNGTPLPPETILAESQAGPYHGKPAGEIGPPPDVIKSHIHSPPPILPPHPHPPGPLPLNHPPAIHHAPHPVPHKPHALPIIHHPPHPLPHPPVAPLPIPQPEPLIVPKLLPQPHHPPHPLPHPPPVALPRPLPIKPHPAPFPPPRSHSIPIPQPEPLLVSKLLPQPIHFSPPKPHPIPLPHPKPILTSKIPHPQTHPIFHPNTITQHPPPPVHHFTPRVPHTAELHHLNPSRPIIPSTHPKPHTQFANQHLPPSPTVLPAPILQHSPPSLLSPDKYLMQFGPIHHSSHVLPATNLHVAHPHSLPIPSLPPPAHIPATIPSPPAAIPPPQTIPQPTSQCQQLVGGGSYTCISFGSPRQPIYAYHTRYDRDGVFIGHVSGFPLEGSGFGKRKRRRLSKSLQSDRRTLR